MNKKAKIILISSLLLNIVFISFLLGYAINTSTLGGFMKFREKQIISVLPENKKALARETFDKLSAMRENNLNNHKIELLELEQIVTAQDFNEKLFLEKMLKFRRSNDRARLSCNEEVAKFLNKLDQDERKKVVEQFKKSMRNFRNY